MTEEKIRETRLRRAAGRQGLKLSRSRRRDRRALDYGLYMLTDVATSGTVFSPDPWASLDDVESYLNRSAR